MNRLKILVIIFTFALTLRAQDLDSLFNRYTQMRGAEIPAKGMIVAAGRDSVVKCGFETVTNVRKNFNNFPEDQKSVLKALLQRPASDTSIVSPKGLFRIHFRKSGYDAPGYDVNQLAQAADSAYNFEVNILGYPPPPADFGEGGDDLIDIYIQNLTFGDYGWTDNETALGNDKYTSYITMDNDFSNYYTKGIDAAKVTVAHELHHAIQIGNYRLYRDRDVFYYETSSTAMEEFVFDSLNDYYGYMNVYFNRPNVSMSYHSGYDLAIFNLFLRDRFGFGILKRIWELIPAQSALNSISTAIGENDSSFDMEFNTFGIWTYYTGTRAITGKYFEEAVHYPQIKPLMTLNFVKPSSKVSVNSEPVSNNFLLYTDSTSVGVNRFMAIISNSDIVNGFTDPSKTLEFKYTLSSNPSDGTKVLDGYYTKLETMSPQYLTESHIFNDAVDNFPEPASAEEFAFPQPFSYSKDNSIYLPADKSFDGTTELYIYSASMKLVYSANLNITIINKPYAVWNGIDGDGKRLPTGVYFYVCKSGDSVKKGKFVVYND